MNICPPLDYRFLWDRNFFGVYNALHITCVKSIIGWANIPVLLGTVRQGKMSLHGKVIQLLLCSVLAL